jgi:hypothetical protein
MKVRLMRTSGSPRPLRYIAGMVEEVPTRLKYSRNWTLRKSFIWIIVFLDGKKGWLSNSA